MAGRLLVCYEYHSALRIESPNKKNRVKRSALIITPLATGGLGLRVESWHYSLGAVSNTAAQTSTRGIMVCTSMQRDKQRRTRTTMHRRLNMRDAFPKSADEYAQPVVRLLQHRRSVMDTSWGQLNEGWNAHSERMAKLGLSPRTSDEGAIKLNVGGSNVTVCWHLLAETEGFEDSTLGALLEGIWGEERIPRDADGRIVLDESPACIKHIIHAIISGRSSSVALGLPESVSRSAVAIDEAPCLMYTAHVMGLPGYVPTHPAYLNVSGGSTILEPFEVAPLGAKIREWVGGSTDEITLIYRATRDGFDTESFESRCGEGSPYTVSLIRVSSGEGNDDDSVVGAYSVIPWGTATTWYMFSEKMFVFMLKDGSATRKNLSKPIKWNPNARRPSIQFKTSSNSGARVGGNDLSTWMDKKTGVCTLKTRREIFEIEEDSPFLALNQKTVVDIEVYRCSTPDLPTTTAPSPTEAGGDVLTDAEAHDIDTFGRSIASSLVEERVVLDHAVEEMKAAGARVSAAVGALETVYGPSVAAGEQDVVVELNVRGVRMTTLRSTLQACPRAALATMFNEDRWPATDKDKDEHGGRLIDCDPTCFSKILDVLRMRKRASWSRGAASGKQKEGGEEKESGGILPGGVLVKETDAEAFGEAVNMYFPGCESFITDLVQPV